VMICSVINCFYKNTENFGDGQRNGRRMFQSASYLDACLDAKRLLGFGLPYVRVDGKCGFVVKQKDGNMPILCFGMLPSLW
ncbi:MAG: hypothetical protein K2L56_02730, partial [Prevotella sp.]|nr:hypothetical protein [Prevotella sp.]